MEAKSETNKQISSFLFILWAGGAALLSYSLVYALLWGIERSGFFNGREKWAKGFENQRV